LSVYYKGTLSAVTHKLNVSGHMLIWTVFLVLISVTRAKILSALFRYTLYGTMFLWSPLFMPANSNTQAYVSFALRCFKYNVLT
jgi:hypothetical protein